MRRLCPPLALASAALSLLSGAGLRGEPPTPTIGGRPRRHACYDRARGLVNMFGKAPTPAPPPEVPSRRFTDAVDPDATVIGPGTRVKGELAAEGSVDLAGFLDGDARVSAHLCVRPGARVTGRLEAKSLVVEGEVAGPSVAAERIEIGATARVRSNVRARVVAIAEGALFEGEVRMDDTGAPGTAITFTEKRR
jgi:cytoskeletal protein CcmA (bactofilin family)